MAAAAHTACAGDAKCQRTEYIIKQYDAFASNCITTSVTDSNHMLLSVKALEAAGKLQEALEYTDKAIIGDKEFDADVIYE